MDNRSHPAAPQSAPIGDAGTDRGDSGMFGAGLGETVRHALTVARRNLWLILAIVAAVLAAAVVYTLLQTPLYTARGTVQINDQGAAVLGEELDQQLDGGTDWDVDRFLNTQLDILRSRALAERVAARLDLYSSQRFHAAMEVPMPDGATPERLRRELVIGLLQQGFAVDLPRSTRIAALTFTSADPVISAEVSNAFAEEFIQASLQRSFDSSAYARNFVAEQLDEARARLESSERELNDYARSAGLIRTRNPAPGDEEAGGGGSSVTTSSLLQLNQAANEAQAQRVAAESRWRAENATPLLSSETVLADPTVQTLLTQRAQTRAQLQAARERYLDEHPVVQQLQSELGTVENQLSSTARNVRQGVRARYDAALAAERQLGARVRQLEGETLAEQDRSVRYNTLAREADTNRQLYEGLLQRYRELNASAGVASSNLTIIDRADVPLGPSSPDLARNLALALLLGLMLAGGLVFLRDQLDDRIRIPEDVESKVGLPLLGVVPKPAGGESMADALDDPKSQVSEAMNSLRQSLGHSTREGIPRILLVTSAQPTEGKSTTSFAIARGFARIGRPVTLIDADLRRPTMHRRLDLPNDAGLATLLTSDRPTREFRQSTGIENLSAISAGPQVPSPTELLTGPRMAAILEELAGDDGIVVIDSPPVLGLADAPSLASVADGTAFVIEADRGGRGAIKAALRRLRAADANLVGAVLTKFDPNRAGNSYSSYYGYDYYSYETRATDA